VIIMQENRSFDSFFGTYPGADGIPAENGQFTVCVPVSMNLRIPVSCLDGSCHG
jgi:phospholipase C